MPKPVILTVDDEPQVLGAVERDLRRQYGSSYRVTKAGSGAEALRTLQELKVRDAPVALLLVDQRMPEMTLLDKSPSAARSLLHTIATRLRGTEAQLRQSEKMAGPRSRTSMSTKASRARWCCCAASGRPASRSSAATPPSCRASPPTAASSTRSGRT